MGINKLKVSPTRELSLISFTKKPNRNIYKKMEILVYSSFLVFQALKCLKLCGETKTENGQKVNDF